VIFAVEIKYRLHSFPVSLSFLHLLFLDPANKTRSSSEREHFAEETPDLYLSLRHHLFLGKVSLNLQFLVIPFMGVNVFGIKTCSRRDIG
jgi:hypothetical protein